MRITIRSAFVVTVIVLSCAGAQATILVPASVDELTRDAGAIVRGRVVAVDARFTPDRRAIETLVTVDAEETLKGSLGPSVQFLVPGGTLGRYRSVLVGAPGFSPGQRVVVFLGWTGPSYPYLLGLSQGVVRVEPGGGAGWVVSPSSIAPPAPGAAPAAGSDPVRRPMPLTDFERHVRAVAAEAR